jgi:hypothetical protein
MNRSPIISLGSLETCIRRETGISESVAQAYHSDKRRMKTKNVRELDSLQDQVRPVLLMTPIPCVLYISKQAFPYAFASHVLTFVQTIVFNSYYAHKDIDEAMRLLHQQPTLHLPIHVVPMLHVEDTCNIKEGPTVMTSLSVSYRRVLSKHQETLSSIPDSMRYQPSALRVAFTAIDRRVLCHQYLR